MHVYTYIYVSLCIYIHAFTCPYIHLHIHAYMYIPLHFYALIYNYISLCASLYIHLHLYTYIYISTHLYTSMQIYIHLHTSSYAHLHLCVHIYLFTYIYIYMTLYIYIYTYIYICPAACLRAVSKQIYSHETPNPFPLPIHPTNCPLPHSRRAPGIPCDRMSTQKRPRQQRRKPRASTDTAGNRKRGLCAPFADRKKKGGPQADPDKNIFSHISSRI